VPGCVHSRSVFVALESVLAPSNLCLAHSTVESPSTQFRSQDVRRSSPEPIRTEKGRELLSHQSLSGSSFPSSSSLIFSWLRVNPQGQPPPVPITSLAFHHDPEPVHGGAALNSSPAAKHPLRLKIHFPAHDVPGQFSGSNLNIQH